MVSLTGGPRATVAVLWASAAMACIGAGCRWLAAGRESEIEEGDGRGGRVKQGKENVLGQIERKNGRGRVFRDG